MRLPRLVVVTDWSLGRERLLGAVEAACSAGPEVAVQHRHPEATARVFLDEARALAELCARGGNPLFVNGRLDVALLLGAHLHLPSRGLAVSDARPLLPERWISAAVHDLSEAKEQAGADLALVSPVFPPGSKPSDSRPALGPDGFSALAQALPCPAFALGGITPRTAPALHGRAAGFAVISAVLQARDPREAASALLAAV